MMNYVEGGEDAKKSISYASVLGFGEGKLAIDDLV